MLQNPNRLEQIEYIFWVCSAIGSIAAGVSGQVIYVSIPLSFSPREFGLLLLNALRGGSTEMGLSGTLRAETPFGPIDLPLDAAGSVPMVR